MHYYRWKTLKKVGVLKCGSSGMIVMTRIIETVLIALLMCCLFKETVSLVFKCQEKADLGLSGKKGGSWL